MILIGLDRDGTIIKDMHDLGKHPDFRKQIHILPKAMEGLKALRAIEGARLVVCTNQSGIARGLFTMETLEEIHSILRKRMSEEGIRLDGWFTCADVDFAYAEDKGIPLTNPFVKKVAENRKPNIGMLKQAAQQFGVKLSECKVYYVGDKVSDIETGLNAHGKGVFIIGEYEKRFESAKELSQDVPGRVFFAHDLVEAAELIREDLTKA